jgi:HEAT repeat protein
MNEIQKLLENLKSPSAAVREGAADALGRMMKPKDRDAVPRLVGALRDESSKVRASAASALGSIGGEAAVPALVEALKDTAYVRSNVIDALGKIGGKRAVTALTSVLKSNDQSMKLRAISALRRIGGEAAVSALVEALRDESSSVRASSAEALKGDSGEAAVSALVEALGDTDQYVREAAADALGRSNAAEAVLRLVEALRDESSKVRASAASALGSIGGEAAVSALVEALRDESSSVRASSAEALGRIGNKRAVPALIDVLRDDATAVRVSATNALGKFVSPEMGVVAEGFKTEGLDWQPHSAMLERGVIEPLVAALADALKDTDSSVRIGAIRSLTKIGGGKAMAALANALQDIGREWALEETRSFIVHEVRSALGPLHMVARRLCESLESRTIDKRKLLEYAQRILSQTETAYQVITQYVDYTRLLVPVLKATNMNVLVRDAVNEVRAQCESSAIEIHESFEETAPVMVEPLMIAQALRNVLTNAIEAVENNGELAVSTRQQPGRLFIIVEDTGPGIKPEHLSRIFELGFTTKRGRQGAGLGLVLVRRIIEEGHDGRVSILNRPGAVGARVILELPVT